MFTKRRLAQAVLGAVALALLLVTPAFAGGWTVVTFDRVPTDMQAGRPITLGLMVRQHGVAPLNDVAPVLRARHATSGETVTANARQEGAVGHFVVDVTFPSAGSWTWNVTPSPFPVVEMGSIRILPAVATGPQQTNKTLIADAAAATARSAARWLGAAALLGGCCLGMWSQRANLVRWRVSRQ